jgi:heme/copper-type cytochrome/quinol oxidase subunit 2
LKPAVFWLAGTGFFAYQAIVLARLLAERGRSANPAEEQERGVEMVWTLVPAALIAALALMLSGFTDGAWIQSRTGDTPLVGPRAIRIDGP